MRAGEEMLSFKRGKVEEVLAKRPGCTEILVQIEGDRSKAINYDQLTGNISPGDIVVVNTTAVELNLGTGGYHFVINNLSRENMPLEGQGHIMKLRYTPMQMKVLSVEEEASPFRKKLEVADSLKQTPVVAALLHSMLAPVALAIKAQASKKIRVVYMMTDGAALPLALSRIVPELLERGLIHGTVTVGNAFGGQIEAVNIYSGLLAAKSVLEADIIIAAMGPGIVGTGTKWGFSGVEQGFVLNAAAVLEGIPLAVPRISFADPRSRHYGISHHTLTVLQKVALAPTVVPMARLPENQMQVVLEQWKKARLQRHCLKVVEAEKQFEELVVSGLNLATMGRSPEKDKAFFLTSVAAGIVAAELAS